MISPQKTLTISVGQFSTKGKKSTNEDCLGVKIPDTQDQLIKGIAGVIADGVSDATGGKEAAEMCVKGFLYDYFSTPDSWTVKTSGQRVINALNRWLYSQGQTNGLAEEKGYLSTMSSIVLVGKTAYIFHIGDSRIYRIRSNNIEQLTRDHTSQITNKPKYLNRAMGLDVSATVDYHEINVEEGDIFLLTTDGVHEWLLDETLVDIVNSSIDLDHAAETTVQSSLESGSNDNLTSLLIRADSLPEASHDELVRVLLDRPFPPLLYPGQILDGLEIESIMYESSRSQLYKVRDVETGDLMIMKTPSSNFQDDPAYIERFITEEWIGKRTKHRNLIDIIEGKKKPTFLYYLMEHIHGVNLFDWAKSKKGNLEVSEVITVMKGIVGGVRALHRLETLHQDLKPDNIMITKENVVKVIDFGSCRVASLHNKATTHESEENLGTMDFGAPEYRFPGGQISTKSDQFSIAVIVYNLLTNEKHPYGERWKKANTLQDFTALDYTPSYHYSPMVPHWVDKALKKALSVNPARRYSSLSEFVHDLETPNPDFIEARNLPYIERNPVLFWKTVSGILSLIILLLLTLLNS
ncbi:MAG: protein kinase domain-containing protein [Akkermansiaceae bacterium]